MIDRYHCSKWLDPMKMSVLCSIAAILHHAQLCLFIHSTNSEA